MKNLSSRRISLFFAVVLVSTIGLLFTHHTGIQQQHSRLRSVYSGPARIQKQNSPNSFSSSSHRKLLHSEGPVKPNRVWGEKCSTSDIVVNQGPTSPLPNGIPTYTVEIVNACATGCEISGIHLKCGWFSSARLINPKLFKRLRHDDCLVNDGKPLHGGAILSFQYANSFPYPLSVSSVVCHG